jgi:hypothetical protein
MARGKKIDIRLRQEADGFVAEVVRRRTSKGTVAERSKRAFSTVES